MDFLLAHKLWTRICARIIRAFPKDLFYIDSRPYTFLVANNNLYGILVVNFFEVYAEDECNFAAGGGVPVCDRNV